MRTTWNLCDLPAWVIASLEYAEDPQPFELQGVRRANRGLLDKLDAIRDPVERGRIFHEYTAVKFSLHDSEAAATNGTRRSLRNSYVRYLRGWGVDSSSVEGAVLKAWVQSRIGIAPTWHRGKVLAEDETDQMAFATDRMKGGAYTNAIDAQLDLVYLFCQYELARRFPGQRWLSLFRGTNDPDEYETIAEPGRRERVVRLNNLSSFTSDEDAAFQFGGTVWRAEIPVTKILFFSGLLPDSILRGEDEYLVIGGVYRVRMVL